MFQHIFSRHVIATLVLGGGVGLASTAALAAPLALSPHTVGSPAVGSGLMSEWVQVRDDYRFSTQPWSEGGAPAQDIGNYSWGTGIWGVRDVAHVRALPADDPNVVARHSGISATVSFANTIYNEVVASGAYGSWGHDYVRDLAPVLTEGGQQTNYAASFWGYVYVPVAGLYDFGLFIDDAFSFSLIGAEGLAYTVSHDTVAGSLGRDYYTLSGESGDLFDLAVGYYGLSLDYFNRLEAGVLDLAWRTPGSESWTGIPTSNLFPDIPVAAVPEPGVLALLGLGGLMLLRRRPGERGSAAPARVPLTLHGA